jgi:hypothetical protein
MHLELGISRIIQAALGAKPDFSHSAIPGLGVEKVKVVKMFF